MKSPLSPSSHRPTAPSPRPSQTRSLIISIIFLATFALATHAGSGRETPALSLVVVSWVSASISFAAAVCYLIARIAQNREDWRDRFHRCLHCGCDRRATPGRCPECGMIPKLYNSLPHDETGA